MPSSFFKSALEIAVSNMTHSNTRESQSHAKRSVALSSVFASLALTLMKGTVGIMTGSMGVLSEAAHSALDFGAALLTYFAVQEGDKPADKAHPYGHAKVESVSAFIETGLLFVTAGWIIYEAVQRLVFKSVEVEATWYAFAVIIISIVVDVSRSRALSRVAKATKSQALEADALHFSSDILSSAVVLVGLVFVLVGLPVADPLAAIGVSLFVTYAGYRLGKRTLDVLVDTAPAGVIDKVIAEIKKVDGVVGIEKLRVRPAGPTVFIEMVITVSRRLSQEKVHSICNSVEGRIKCSIPEADMIIHTKPVSLDNESIIERIHILAANHNLTVHDMTIQTLGEKKHVSYDLEMDSKMTIAKAHQLASHLEDSLKGEMDGGIEVYTHIEPYSPNILAGKPASQSEEARVENAIEHIAKKITGVKEIHGLQVRKIKTKLFVSFHCLFEDDTPLEDAHRMSSQFEHLMHERIPNLHKVVIHPEPLSDK
jgi:cation diffusion facilitator family transporter